MARQNKKAKTSHPQAATQPQQPKAKAPATPAASAAASNASSAKPVHREKLRNQKKKEKAQNQPKPAAKKAPEPESESGSEPELEAESDLPNDDAEIAALSAIEKKLDALDQEYQAALLRITAEIEAKRAPLYVQRSAVTRKLRLFWPTTITALPIAEEMIEEADVPLLSKLVDLMVVRDNDNPASYQITFEFAPDNGLLAKNTVALRVAASSPTEAEVRVVDPLSFLPGKDFTGLAEAKKDEAGKKGKKRPASYMGFFTYFFPTRDNMDEAVEFFNDLAGNLFPAAPGIYMDMREAKQSAVLGGAGGDDSDMEGVFDDEDGSEGEDDDDEMSE
ncbi:hypothetical protein AMAG_13201 [Allomyces macrogynus ATCC 38327]|uniref:Nucleosome assembly protein n=1 Tax=Allomyces macrogynus (strain ATCC 38327) TaxID=578462 RepID=A0A0L0T0C7_ALLM3|nr:hypothetical protein AMAG_13201 [Allomyces macrogynus ATCC 38327]|eukprot:KNE68029.1 hypothetical protein AMAG_13201 [Allomyces macrogynus ATCC 38327]